MSLLKPVAPPEVTGQTLAEELEVTIEQFNDTLSGLAAEAADREGVVDARLASLEREKAVLGQVRAQATSASV